MNRGAWRATVHGVAKSRTRLSDQHFHFLRGFLCGSVVKNPPANAGDTGSIPALGRSRMPWTKAHEPQPLKPAHLEPVLHTRSHGNEKSMDCKLESSPWLPQLEKSPCSNEDPTQPKINK